MVPGHHVIAFNSQGSRQVLPHRRRQHLYHRRTAPSNRRGPGLLYRLSVLRYYLSKLRAKGLVEKIPHSRRYQLLPNGYRICLVFLKLFEGRSS